MSDTVVYHASLEDVGDEFVFDKGGFHEKVDSHGTPQTRVVSGTFAGYEMSETPQLCASRSPEAAVFAVLKNLVNETGDASGAYPVHVSVYALHRDPDVSMENAIAGDFSLLEEVRFNNPDDTPVHGERVWSGQINGNALGDVELTYLPTRTGVNDVIASWGEKVKEAIQLNMETGTYPDMGSFKPDVSRPNIDAYKPSHYPTPSID